MLHSSQMSSHKKFFFGLYVLLGIAGFFYLGSPKASAATPDFITAVFTKVSDKEIDAAMPGGAVVQFWDNNTGDSTFNWKPTIGSSQAAGFSVCDGTQYEASGKGNNPAKGITYNSATRDYTIDIDFDGGDGCPPPIKAGVNNLTADLGKLKGDNQICSENGACNAGRVNASPPVTPVNDSSCAGNSGSFALAWMACPLLTAASDFTDKLLNEFENLLSFTIPQNPGADNGMAQVKQSWAIFRTLASALLVVVLLIVVISQAVGGTFLDAYSVRKMLPKIVIAVIAMQLSWSLIVWIVLVVDDLGKGLFNLMYQPFQGASQMSLGALLNHANIGAGSQAAINWVAIMGGLVLGAAALPTMLVFLFTAVLALLVGFVTLILRKLIIILALIFVPVALILWILPGSGTQRLWKLWLDNFTKALLMFPLVVMLVAGGRILAYVAGTQGNGTFLNLLIVLVGFFGPLFILPRAFRWGGSAMQFAGNMATSISKPITEKGGAGLKGIGERWQGRNADKLEYNQRGRAAPFARGLRRVQSGHMLPTKRSRALALQTGSKWAAEEKDLATIYADSVYNKANTQGYKDQNGKDYKPGVEAAKVATAELTRHKDARIGEEAVKKFVATASWPELQSFEDSSGRKIFEDNPNWTSAAAKDPETYRSVLRSRTDAAAHIIQGAEAAVVDREKAASIAGPEPYFASPTERLDFMSSHRINTSITKQMANEDFGQESDGFWEEAARVSQLTDADGNFTQEAQKVQTGLKKRFEAIRDIGGTAPQQLLGHLANGGTLQTNVETILGGEGTLQTYVNPRAGVGTPAAPTPTAPVPPPGDTVSPGGVIIPPTYRPGGGGNMPPPPPTPPAGEGGGTEGGPDIPHDTPPEDFGPGGRFPPPNIPPGPGNV